MAGKSFEAWKKKYSNWTPSVTAGADEAPLKRIDEYIPAGSNLREETSFADWAEKYSNWQPTPQKPEWQPSVATGKGGAEGNASYGKNTERGNARKEHFAMRKTAAGDGAADPARYVSREEQLYGQYLAKVRSSGGGRGSAQGNKTEDLYADYLRELEDYYADVDVDAARKELEETRSALRPYSSKVTQLRRSRASRSDRQSAEEELAQARATLGAKAADLQNEIEMARSVQADRNATRAMDDLQKENAEAYNAISRLATYNSRPNGSDESGWEPLDENGNLINEKNEQERLRAFGYSDKQIDALVEQRKRILNKEVYDHQSKYFQELAQSGFWGAAAATAYRAVSGIPVGIAGAGDLVAQRASGKPVDWYSGGIAAQRVSSDIVKTVAGEIEKSTNWEIAGQNVAAFLYQTGISMTDSAAIAGLTALGVPAWLGTAALGTMAGTQAAIDAHERGVSDSKAFTTGVFAGVAEAVFEKISLEKLLEPGAVTGATAGKRFLQVLRNLGIQGFTEGSEEVFTDLANHMADEWINGGRSEFNENVRRYVLSGMSEEEAYKAASRDFAVQVGSSFVGGALSGGVMSGVTQAITTHSANKQAKAIYGVDPQALVDEALELDPNNETAQKAKEKLEQGKQLSGGEIRLLVEQNERQIAKTKNTANASDDTTAVNDDPAEHTEAEQARIEKYKSAVNPTLRQMFERVKENGGRVFERMNLSNVSDRQAADATKLLGGDYSGYTNAINSNGARHIIAEHGEDGTTDHSLADLNDAARMEYVLENYDTVEQAKYASGEADTSAEFRNADDTPAPMLRYKKRVNGTYYVVEAVPSSKYKKFWVVSAYMNGADTVTQAPDAQNPGNTPDASLASPVSATNSIPQAGGKSQGDTVDGFLTAAAAEDLAIMEEAWRRSGADENMLKDLGIAYRAAFAFGTTGRLEAQDRAELRDMGLRDDEIQNAFVHGKAAANAKKLKGAENDGGKTEESIRVRDGEKRNGGESAGGQGTGVEQEARVRPERSARRGGAEAESGADGEAGASQSSTRTLIGDAGSDSGGSVSTVSTRYSKDTETAAKMARQRGVDAVFFTGGELTLASGDAARGYIDLKRGKVWVRADDPQYSAEQIMRHELGHDAVAKGEIDPGEVYDRLTERYGEENMGRIMALYGELYEDAGLSADEVWEEILCDSLADMNVFSDLPAVAELAEDFLRSAKEEARQNAEENTKAESKKAADTGGKMSYVGKRSDGIEVYQTSKEVQEMTLLERKKRFLELMENEYRGRTAKFVRNGHAYYARFEEGDVRKNIYGDNQSDWNGLKAKIRTGADGDIFELVENAVYKGSDIEKGKNNRAHRGVRNWDYFVKKVQIDGRVYDLLVNVRKRDDGEFVYNLRLNEDKKTEVAPVTSASQGIGFILTGANSNISIPNADEKSNTQSQENFESQSEGGKTSRVADGMEQLQEENRELREQVKGFEKALRSAERRIQNARESRDQWRDRATFHTERVCREIIKAYHGTVSEEEIHDGIKKLTYYAARKDGITYEAMKHLAAPVAAQVVKSASVVANDEEAQTWSDIKKHLRAGHIKVSREVIRDIDDWGAFWRRNGRRMNLVTGKDGIGVDVAYDELRERFGEAYFPESITHPADQLRRIEEVYDNMQPVFENPYSLNIAMAAEHCANDLVDMVMKEVSRGYSATYTGQLEEKLYQSRKYTEKLLEKERAHSDEQIQALKKHWQAQRTKEIEGRQDSELRQRLLNVAKRLKNKKLPTVSRNLLNQYAEQMLTEAQRDIFSKLDTESRSMRSATREGLTWLRDQYERLEETDPNFIPDPATQERIKRLSKLQIDSLTHQDVVDLTYVLLNIENEIRNAKNLIDSAEKRDLREAGVAIMRDIRNSPGSKASGIGNFLDKFIVTETLSPLRQVRRMVGYVENDPLLTATRELADGQRRSFDYKMRAQARFQKFVDNKAFMDRIAGKHAELMTIQGIGEDGPAEVQITPAMKISLYLHSKNNQSLRHIAGGGIRVPDAAEYRKGNMAEAYAHGTVVKLEAGEVKKIAGGLTAEERRFADAVFGYFNTMSKEEVNAVSEKLLGYPVAEVENYFPINTDDSFTKKDFESIKYDGSIEGMGFLKERINSASPIYLRDVTDVLRRSIDQHSRYVGLGVAVRNFNKLWGVTARNYLDENEPGASSSVQSTVKQQWGEMGRKYIEKMMSDLQTGGKEQSVYAEALNKVRSAYAGAVLTLNLSVAMKQAASYPTAAAVVGWKPLILAFKNVGKVDLELIAAYTPLQWYRSQGFSTQELGDMAKRGIKWPAALNWVQGADLLTTRKLWKAAEIYVRENNPDLRRGTPAEIRAGESPFYKAVAEVYNRIIEETQPNYTTMQRPQLLRSEDTLLQNLQMFKTQPFQNFNILYDAVGEWQAKARAYQVEQTEENEAAVRKARKKVGRAVSSQVAQLFVFAGMTFLWNAFRGKKDKYKDKEGEVTIPSVLGGIGLDMAGGLLSELPFGSDTWEFGFNLASGGKYYGVSDVTTSAINDAANQISNAYKTVSGLLAGDIKDANTVRLRLDGAVDAVSKLFSMPYENVANLGKAVFRIGAKALEGDYLGEYSYLQLTTDPTGSYKGDYYDLLYLTYKRDMEAHREIRQRMIESGYFDEEKIKSAMENRMKEEEGVKSVKELKQRYEP